MKKHIELVPPCDVCPFVARLTVIHSGRKPTKDIIDYVKRELDGTVVEIRADRQGYHERATTVTCAPRTGNRGACMRAQVSSMLSRFPNALTSEVLNDGCKRTV